MTNRDGGLVFEARSGPWQRTWTAGAVKPSTYESYERVIRCHLKPGLGKWKLKTLAPDHVQYFYRTKLDIGLASGTVRLMHAVLNHARDQAVKLVYPLV